MIRDQEFIFMDEATPKADTAGGATDFTVGSSYSTNVYRQGPLAAGNVGLIDFAAGDGNIYWVTSMDIAPASATGTLNIRLVSSASPTLSSPRVHRSTGALAVNAEPTFALNNILTLRIDPNDDWLEYIGVEFVIGTAVLTAGTFSSALTNHVDAWKAYASGSHFS